MKYKPNLVLLILGLVLLYSCLTKEDNQSVRPKKGFRPFFVGDSLRFEYKSDTTSWTRNVKAFRDTVLNDTTFVFFSVKDSIGQDFIKGIDSLGEGYQRYMTEPVSIGGPLPTKVCDMEAWYPGTNAWPVGEGKKFRINTTDINMKVDTCIFNGGLGPITSYKITIVNYVDSALGTIYKKSICTTAGTSCKNSVIEIGLENKNGILFDYNKVIETYVSEFD